MRIREKKQEQQEQEEQQEYTFPTKVRLDMISDATVVILEQIAECAKEKDADVQQKRAHSLAMLTESLARLEFKFNVNR